jgi:CheY-like chemotaxis protein
VFSNDSIAIGNTAEPVSAWQSASAWLNVMAAASGSNRRPGKEPPFSSPYPNTPHESIPQRLNLLLAEDNLPDALLVREAIKMEDLPVEVYIAPDGERAVELIVKAENDPDAPCPHVLLLDINLPRIDGFEVLRRIRASHKFKNIPVLMVTSSDSPADRTEAAKLGARYFRKPVTYDEFVKIGAFLRQFLEESGLL